MITLGVDTSNYTTSVALYDDATGDMTSVRRLLRVKPGELGLRQSEALFQHTVALPELMGELFRRRDLRPDAVGVSVKPCDFEGSYMPCFLAGKSAAESLAAAMGIPVFPFSHQAGHIAAVLYDAKRTDLADRDFLAFHVSGGTTDAVLVRPGTDTPFVIEKQAGSLDLKAGQAIDRVGQLLGLPFPAGKALDALSLQSEKTYRVKPFIRDGSVSLSGVENKCRRMLADGASPADIAKYCLTFIVAAVDAMARSLTEAYPGLPLVFSGGVSANTLLREHMTARFGAVFSLNGFGTDNAAGAAYLAAKRSVL